MNGVVISSVAALLLLTTSALAQEDAGREEYMVACAGCHGESAKGNGPLAGLLDIQTPDLTSLAAKKGNGEFPFDYTLRMIDGRNEMRAHGSKMPVWGDRYAASATSERGETADMVARGRILSLIYYLASIQQ
ncbi:c-type cytochrome [Thioclava sp. DLFJ4-1]|uniref:c-type cytochrome n=1 Tax=Thioclava sp. DLFJ4-1 TaxID=1915313 RepID=UPI0009980D9C|nr:c-type cytochrome [Thioclava sp. DLFJ4-1]OOY18186.1 3-methyladenine DNA glycosylase [Thioclava sp. DLFJ4-1]